jgi:hypothetical protein
VTAVADYETIHRTGTPKSSDTLPTEPPSIAEDIDTILREFYQEFASNGWTYNRLVGQFVWTSCEADPRERKALVLLSHIVRAGEIYPFVMDTKTLEADRIMEIVDAMHKCEIVWKVVEQRLKVSTSKGFK